MQQALIDLPQLAQRRAVSGSGQSGKRCVCVLLAGGLCWLLFHRLFLPCVLDQIVVAFWEWYSKNKAVADEHGITLEDFDQEGFFAVQAAAKAYDPEKGSFATLLGNYVQSKINKAVCGEHSRLVTTEDGKQVRWFH